MATKSYLPWISVMLLSVVSLCVGCGAEPFPMAPVSGTLTLDGEPVADAQVSFEPMRVGKETSAGPGSYARTDAQGRFRLQTAAGQSGAVVGEHQVTFSTYRARQGENFEPVTVVEERVPERYRLAETALTFTVPAEGADNADFHLESSPTKR